MTKAAYAVSKQVYDGDTRTEDAVLQLVNDCGMNKNSARDYINNFQKIMNDNVYKRPLNREATDYILTNICRDYGISQLEIALQAVQLHIKYYYETTGNQLSKTKEVIRKHKNIITITFKKQIK